MTSPIQQSTFVPVDPGAPPRTERALRIIAMILNSLIRSGVLQQGGESWGLSLAAAGLGSLNGQPGAPGRPGEPGSQFLSGSADPPDRALGRVGDVYLAPLSKNLYQKSQPGLFDPPRWSLVASLAGGPPGPAGIQGPPGSPGIPGATGPVGPQGASGGGGGGSSDNSMSQGRLTLTSGTAITTADVTSTTVYYTPLNGNQIALYYNSAWSAYTFTEKSVAVPATTSTPFDVFAQYSGTAVQLVTHSWSSATARATNLTTQDGILVLSGDATQKYLGTGCTTSVSGNCSDAVGNRLLWNLYNRRPRKLYVHDATASWNCTSTTFRSANGNAANCLNVVAGQAEDLIQLRIAIRCQANNSSAGQVGVGVNSTTTNSADTSFCGAGGADNLKEAVYVAASLLGLNTYNWIEKVANAGATATFTGNGSLDFAALIGFCLG